MLKIRSQVVQCFREFYFAHNFTEVTPPTIVQTQCEGICQTMYRINFCRRLRPLQDGLLWRTRLHDTVFPALSRDRNSCSWRCILYCTSSVHCSAYIH